MQQQHLALLRVQRRERPRDPRGERGRDHAGIGRVVEGRGAGRSELSFQL
jgi:hypothetical protein